MIKKGRRELWAHKGQYSLLILVLGLGIAMFNSMYDFMDSRVMTVDALYEEARFMDVQISYQYGVSLDQDTSEDILQGTSFWDIVDGVEYRLVLDVYINQTYNDDFKLTKGLIFGYDYIEDGQNRDITVNKPLFFDPPVTFFNSSDAEACYLEKNFADVYNITSGDTIKIIMGSEDVEYTVYELINVPDYMTVTTADSLFPIPESLGVMVVPLGTALANVTRR